MKCTLNDKVLRAYRSVVVKDLLNIVEQEKPFNLKEYLQSKYAEGMELSGNDNAIALEFVMVTPQFIAQTMYTEPVLFGLALDANELRNLVVDFSQETGLDKVQEYLNLKVDISKELAGRVDLEDEEEDTEKTPITKGHDTDVSKKAIVTVSRRGDFIQTAPTFLTDAEREVLEIDDSKSNYNVLDPTKVFYFKVKRSILNALKGAENGSEINFKGQGPVFLKAVEVSTLDEADKKPLSSTEKLTQEQLDKGIALMVVNEAGIPLRFDSATGEISETGKPVYFNMRNTQDFFKSGEFTLSKGEAARAQAISEHMGITTEAAREYLKEQILFVDTIRNYVKKNPDTNSVMLNITGGSLGVPGNPNVTTPLSEVNFGKDATGKPNRVTLSTADASTTGDLWPGQLYFELNNDQNTPIKVNAPFIKDTGKVEMLVDLFTETLYDDLGKELTAMERKSFAEKYIYINKERLDISIFGKKNELFVVKLNGVKLDLSTEKSKQLAKDQLRKHFSGLTASKTVLEKNIGNRKIVTNEADYKLNAVIKGGDGKYRVIEPIRLNVDKEALESAGAFEQIISIEKDTNGKYIINTEAKNYLAFILDNNFTIPYDLNANKEIGQYQAYTTFDIVDSEIEKVYGKETTEEVPGKIPSDIDPSIAYLAVLEKSAELQGKDSPGFKMQKVLMHNLKNDTISPDYARAVLHEWSMRKGDMGAPNLTEKQERSISSLIERYSKTPPVRKVEETPVQDEVADEVAKTEKPELKQKDVPSTNTPDFDVLQSIRNNAKDDTLNKLFDQKEVDVKATTEQIAAAKKWYENHPLNKYFPFEALFNMVNSSNRNSIATWQMHGIRLYEGSDYSDLYHESWHAFSQAFMTKKERAALYKSVTTLNGSFRDYNGKTILFALAKPKQIEEYLAEGFRTYMLSDGKSLTKSKKVNSFFDIIFRVLDMLFGNLTWNEVMIDPNNASNMIKDLYEKLRVGDLAHSSFNQENAQWDKLYSGIRASNKDETVTELSYEASADVIDIMDSLISDFIDLNNTLAPLTPEEQVEYMTIKAQIGSDSLSGTELTKAEERLNFFENNPKKRHSFTSTMMNSSTGRKEAFMYVESQMKVLAQNLQTKFNAETNEAKKSDIGKRIQTLEWSIKNFGKKGWQNEALKDVEVSEEGAVLDVIGYYTLKSARFLSDLSDNVYGLEVTKEADVMLKGYDYLKLDNNYSSQDLAKKEVLFLVKGLHELDSKGKPVYSDYGVKVLADFGESWNKLAVTLENTLDTEDMYDKLVSLSKDSYPEITQMLGKLGNPRTTVTTEQTLWSAFTSAFNLARVPLVQLALERTKTGFNSKVGESFGVFKGVGRNWESNFQRTSDNKYLNTDEEGNFLNLDKVLKKFPLEDSIEGKEVEFLNAIGISVTDNKVMRQILNKGDKKFGYRATHVKRIWEKVQWLQDNREVYPEVIGQIRSINDIMKAYPEAGMTDTETGNFGMLQKMEMQFGNERSNFMVQNAEGNTQFEHTLNNTMTVVVNTINAVNDYDELMLIDYMQEFNIERNPELKYNKMLNSIFDLDPESPNYRQKRKNKSEAKSPDVKLKMANLSGALVYDQEGESQPGIAAAKADEFTKLILDVHLANNPNHFMAEMMRHADKSTSFSTYVTNLNVDGTGNHYIDLEKFVNADDYHKAGFKIIQGYLFGEHARIKQLEAIDKIAKGDPDFVFDFGYLKRGKEFQIFDDILIEKGLKKEILAVEGSLEEYFNSKPDDESFDKAKTLQNRVREAIDDYFDKQIKSVTTKFDEAGYISDSLTDVALKVMPKNENGNRETAKDILIRSTVYNNWIHNVETLTFFYGNLAQYKTAKQDFHKRNAGIGSTGTLFRVDKAMKRYINSTVGYGYAEQEGYETDAYDGTINTGVIEDVKIRSVYFDELAEGQRLALEKQGLEPDEIQVKLYGKGGSSKHKNVKKGSIMYAYDNMEEGDAQGLITFDMYRILNISQGEWDFNTQEKTYQKIIRGENFDQTQILNFFPPAKYQYWGTLKTDIGPSIKAFHKYSLMPLIPGTYKKGSNADILHRKMMKDKLGYITFQTGSKMGTLSKETGTDKLYDKNRVINEDLEITKNVIFVNFLKNQLKISKQFKGSVTFPTQLRKLIEDGLMEYGVPVGYEPNLSVDDRIKKWESLSETKKLENNKYKLLKAYEQTVAALTASKKEKLLKKAGLTQDKNGKIVGNTEKLWEFVKKELTRQDLSDHELDFIQFADGKLTRDLSMSLSADRIEKLLNAVVTRSLIKQKFHGEGLFQQSAAFMESLESKHDYTNPTDEDIAKWGSNDLPGLRKGPDGKTMAAKAKIALQGDYENLLYLNGKDGKPLTVYDEYEVNGIMRRKMNYNASLDALNTLLKDDAWLDMENHREMVTIVGVRIPVQGLNSMEYIEVYEFLPKTANNVIIMPSEIVAKAGSDFDIDKLTLMMPNISKKYSKPFTNTLLRELGAEYPKLDFSRLNVDIILDALKDGEETYTLTAEDRQILMALDNYVQLEVTYNTDQSEKGLENRLIGNMKNILELEDNYAALTRPNGTDILDPIQKEMVEVLNKSDYNPSFTYGEGSLEQGQISPTRVLELEYNLYKHKTNNIGKQTLGLGAVDNTYNTLFNRINAYLNNEDLDGNIQTIKLAHNTLTVDGKKVISLAGAMDKKNENKISDVINQLLNGWLDIAKDAWIFNIQGNKELAPALLFLVQAGVPIRDAVYMISTPLVREYVAKVRKYKSTFAEALGYGTEPNLAKDDAARDILRNLGLETHKTTEFYDRATGKTIQLFDQKFKMSDILKEGAKRKGLENMSFDTATLKTLAHDEATEKEQAAAFIHFLQIEQMAKSVRDVKLNMNLDTRESKSLFEASDKNKMITELKEDGRLGEGMIERLLTDSPISSFAIQDFQLELWKDAFPLRNHKVVNEFLSRFITLENVKNTLGDKERFANTVKNDLLSYIFQNTFNAVNLEKIKSYKGFEVKTATDVVETLGLDIGVFMEKGILYMDKAQIIKDYVEGNYNKEGYTKLKLAKVNQNAFKTVDDYAKFLLEREYLRQSVSLSEMSQTKEFILKAKILKEGEYFSKLKDESAIAYSTRFNRGVYEIMLRDQALDNSFNSWKIFQSQDTFADQFSAIKKEYPELVTKFPLLKYFNITKNDGFTNIKLVDTQIDTDMANRMHEMFIKLTKPNELGLDNADDAHKVADFFRKFPVVAFLQSGLASRGNLAMGKFMPQELLFSLMEKPVAAYVEHFNTFVNNQGKVVGMPLILEDFANMFLENNSNRKFSTMFRHKNYKSGIKLRDSVKVGIQEEGDRIISLRDIPLEKEKAILPIITELPGLKVDASVYQPNEIVAVINGNTQPSEQIAGARITSNNYTRADVKANPDVAYVFTENNHSITAFPDRQGGGSAIIRPEANAFAIVTKKIYDYNTRENVDYSNTEADFKEFTEINTKLINELKDSGKSGIVFPKGFASDKAKLPTKFALWLQNELLNNFGLITELNENKTGLISTGVVTLRTVSDLREHRNYSGAAKGADTEWAIIGRELGLGTQVDYVPADYENLSDLEKAEVEASYKKVVRVLGRKELSPTTYSGKLVRRDYMQAKSADAVFAIIEGFDRKDTDEYGYLPKGGTAYAVTTALEMGKPVYLFNQSDNSWWVYDELDGFVQTSMTPTLTKNFAGIGTRNINDKGKQAIRDVYNKTLNKPTQRTGQLDLFGGTAGAPIVKTPMAQNSIIVYDSALNPRGSEGKDSMQRDAVIHYSDLNKFGLVTKKLFTQGSASSSEYEFQDVKPSGSITTEIDPEAKKAIDLGIKSLKELSEGGNKLAFSSQGYGQYLIGADENGNGASAEQEIGGKTFDYLSEQLYSNFGYTNPNWLNRTQGKAKVQELMGTPVTNEMVRDYMNKIC